MSTPTPSAPAAPAAPSTPAAPAAPSTTATPAQPTAPPSTVTAVPAIHTVQQPAEPTTPTAPQQGEPQNVASLPQWAQDHIRALRTEAADYRTRAQGTAPAAEPTAPQAPAPAAEGDLSRLPQWAQRAVNDGQGAAQQLALQSAIIAAAPAAGADIARLLDSQTAMRTLAAVDANDATAVQQAITNLLGTHRHLAAQAPGPARAGAEFTSGGAGEVTPAQFAAMDYQQRTELYQSDPETYRRLAGS
ncbi:hypothetical protein ACIQUU_32075 [Streptomyces sp. NPDC101116]|uniref:hypothetical protein n=1 Tax=Streptomyces sp. NPDC101116 TaxID=3366107 RepID=UPI00380760A9